MRPTEAEIRLVTHGGREEAGNKLTVYKCPRAVLLELDDSLCHQAKGNNTGL